MLADSNRSNASNVTYYVSNTSNTSNLTYISNGSLVTNGRNGHGNSINELTLGGIIGIVIGCVVSVVLMAIGVILFLRNKNKRRQGNVKVTYAKFNGSAE